MLDTATGEFYKLPDGEMLLKADGNEYTKTNWIKILKQIKYFAYLICVI